MAIFHMYVDESGKLSGKSDFTSLCGYVAHAAEWQRFNLEWDNCRFRWQVPPIHMGQIMADEPRDKDWKKVREGWGDLWVEKRNDMLMELAMIIQRANLVCVGAIVDANGYRASQVDPTCTLHYPDSNVFAFHYMIMTGIEKIETIDKYSPVSIVIDDDQENAFGYYGMLNTLRTHEADQFEKVRRRVHGICFCNDASYPGLQAADMIAYVARRYKVDKEMNTDPDKEPDISAIPFSLYPHLTLGGTHQPKVYSAEVIQKVGRGTAKALKRISNEE